MQLRLQLQTTKKGSSTITEYLQRMKSIADNLAAAAQRVSDTDLVLYILGGLGPEYEAFIVSVTTRSDTISLDDLTGMLLTHEYRLETLHSSITSAPPEVNIMTRNSGTLNSNQRSSDLTYVSSHPVLSESWQKESQWFTTRGPQAM